MVGLRGRNQVWMTREFKMEWVNVTSGIACLWMACAGEEMYARVRCWEEMVEDCVLIEWKDELTAARWESWKRSLGEVLCDHVSSEKTRSYAMKALERMQNIEAWFASSR